jgi:hypothetical protein
VVSSATAKKPAPGTQGGVLFYVYLIVSGGQWACKGTPVHIPHIHSSVARAGAENPKKKKKKKDTPHTTFDSD